MQNLKKWLKGRKKRRLHHPFSTDDNDSGDEFDENIVTFQEPFVLNISNAQGAGLENAAMLGAVQSVNLSELLEPNVLKKEWQIEEEQEESHIQDNDLVVKPGMILPFSVLSVTKQGEHRKIQVSVLPKNVNRHIDPCFLTKGCLVYGMIYEREEYGYRVTFGLESIQYDGFLPLEETESQILKSGSLIWCVITHVKKVDKRTVVKVSTNRQLVCDSKISYQSKWPFGCVFPGLRMEGQVLQKKWKGSWTHIKLASNMTGFVYSMETIRESFLDLRVIFVDVGKRVIYLSSVESLVGFLEPAKLPNAWKLGNILKNVIVEGHLSSPKGILLRHSESNTILFAPNSQLADSDISADAALSSLPSLQSIVCCRIVAFSPLDGTIIVSMKPSILSKTIVSFDELHPGMPVQCKIESVRENGCLCIVEDKIRAWIPQMHFGDTVGARLKNKFVAGKKVKGCVLSIFQDSHRCTITTKKKFIDNQYPVIASIQDAKSNIGSAAYCCVYQVSSSRGLQVEFFQGVKGFLPVSYMGLEKLPSLEWLSENYPVGKTLKVWILSVHEESHRIIVSLSRDVIMNDDSSAIVTYGAIVGIEYGNLIVEVCLLDSRKRALLPKEHLSDFAYLSERIYSLLVSYFESNSSSLPLEQVVILRSRISSNDCRALVSLKRSLIQFALTYPSLSSDRICSEWKANQMLPGFVEKETLHKYLIGFIGNWKVWIDKNEWSLNGKLMLRTPRKHETVWCRLHVESRERKVVCLWTQLNNFTPQEWDKKFSFYPTRYFDDVEQWKSMLLQWRVINEATVTRQSLFKQGEIVSAQLVSKRPHGYVFSLSNNVVKEEQVTGVSLSEVEQVSSQATKTVTQIFFSSGTETSLTPITCNSRLRGIVLLIKEEYLIMRIPQLNNCLVYLTSWDPRVRANLSVIYSVDSVIEGTVYYCSERLTMLVAMDANDEKKRMIENVQVGDHVIGRIVRISTVHLHLFIPRYSVYGRIHCSQIMSEPGKDTLISPLEHFEIGQQVEAKKIIAKDHSKKYQILDLTLNKNDVVTMEKNLVDWSNLSCRQCLTGFVHKIMTDKVLISFSSKVIGVMKRWGFTQNEQLLSSKQIFSSLRTGQPLHCTIIRLNQSRKLLEVALSELVKPVHVGDSVVAHVGQVLYGAEFCLELPKWVEWSLSTCRGVLSFTDIDDNFDRATAKISHIKSRKWIKGIIIECSSVKEKPIAIVSLRNSDAHPTQSTPKDIRWKNLMDLKAGQLVRGFIRHHSLKGCFVQLSSSIIGRVMLRNLSDGFVQNVEETFPLGQLVTAKVIDIQNGQTNDIFCSSKKGLRLQGTVKNIQPFGIFVSLGLGVTGLCHLSTLEKQSQYRIGEVIWVQVDNVDREKGRINLHPLDPIKENGRIGTLRQLVGIDSTSQNSSLQHSYIDSVSVDANRDVVESSDESEGNGSDCEVLQVSESFQLQDEILLENDDSQNRANKNNVAKMVVESTEQQQDDERLERYSDEEIELERSLKEPQNEEDFERHVLASPDDSSIWIRYMAYFISMGQETARRALEKISVRNQDEKLNIWIAYLNLEAQYGDESHLASILEEACSRTNAEKLLLNFAKSMQKTRKEKSEEIYLRACRQFKHSPEVWMQVGTFYYEKKKNISEGRKILERALLSLPKQDHIQVITKFTVLEYKFGSIERARTIFENMISSFPKRLDIWNVYLDMEWKQVDTEEDKERLRLLFERACSLSLSSKKMKFFV
ncbi:rRNA biogenesis protein rrp5 [Galdieria sulphuraria]|nr:rRNA biogenesis protein rrp5 [Galdieria sulphuraria]